MNIIKFRNQDLYLFKSVSNISTHRNEIRKFLYQLVHLRKCNSIESIKHYTTRRGLMEIGHSRKQITRTYQ